MKQPILLLLFWIVCACEYKRQSIEYWVKPENQKGDTRGFVLTEDYCSLLEKESKEWKRLDLLYDSLVAKMQEIRKRNPDSLDFKVAKATEIFKEHAIKLNEFMHWMIESVGGYCRPKFISLPSLPYRDEELRAFWENQANQETYLKIFSDYNSKMYTLVKSQVIVYQDSNIDVNSFKRMNNVEALVRIIEIQHQLMVLFEKTEKIIEKTQEADSLSI